MEANATTNDKGDVAEAKSKEATKTSEAADADKPTEIATN